MSIEDFGSAFSTRNPDWVGGEATNFEFSVKEIHLKSGDVIRPQTAGVTAIVGANNAGKSTILRELVETLQHHPSQPPPPRLSVDRVELSTKGETNDLFAWLHSNSTFALQGQRLGFTRAMAGFEEPGSIAHFWNQRQQGLGSLAGFMCFYGNAAGRFSIGGSAEMRESVDDPPSHPVHYLQDSPKLTERISRLSEEVFHHPLTLDTLARTVRLRVGKIDAEAPRIDDVPPACQGWVSPPVHSKSASRGELKDHQSDEHEFPGRAGRGRGWSRELLLDP